MTVNLALINGLVKYEVNLPKIRSICSSLFEIRLRKSSDCMSERPWDQSECENVCTEVALHGMSNTLCHFHALPSVMISQLRV